MPTTETTRLTIKCILALIDQLVLDDEDQLYDHLLDNISINHLQKILTNIYSVRVYDTRVPIYIYAKTKEELARKLSGKDSIRKAFYEELSVALFEPFYRTHFPIRDEMGHAMYQSICGMCRISLSNEGYYSNCPNCGINLSVPSLTDEQWVTLIYNLLHYNTYILEVKNIGIEA